MSEDELGEQRRKSRQVQLDQYATEELVNALTKRELTRGQALKLESMLLSIPTPQGGNTNE